MKAKTIYTQRPDEVEVVEAPNGAVAYFRENIEEIEAPGDEGGIAYQAEEYSLYVSGAVSVIRGRITANPAPWFAKAKQEAAMRKAEEDAASAQDPAVLLLELAADHEERLCMIELFGEEV